MINSKTRDLEQAKKIGNQVGVPLLMMSCGVRAPPIPAGESCSQQMLQVVGD